MTKYFKDVKSLEDLKSQFRKLAKKYHPDGGGEEEILKEISCEFDALYRIWKNRHEKETGEKVQDTAQSTRRRFYTEWGWEGSRYRADFSTTEIAKAIRIYCKEQYPTWKFSVTSHYFSGGSSISVSVMEAPEQIFDLQTCRQEYMKHLEAERNGNYGGRGLSLNLGKMIAEDRVYWQLHKVDDGYKPYFTEYGYAVIKDVYDYMQSYNYDDSDGMIDYFNCNFYEHFDIGKGTKGFKVVPKTARVRQKKAEVTAEGSKKTAEEQPSPHGMYSISETAHTKTGKKIWLVKIVKSLDREEFSKVREKMDSLGGYYSRYLHGFIFKDDPSDNLGAREQLAVKPA